MSGCIKCGTHAAYNSYAVNSGDYFRPTWPTGRVGTFADGEGSLGGLPTPPRAVVILTGVIIGAVVLDLIFAPRSMKPGKSLHDGIIGGAAGHIVGKVAGV